MNSLSGLFGRCSGLGLPVLAGMNGADSDSKRNCGSKRDQRGKDDGLGEHFVPVREW
jgi:hypothetical protein